MHGGDIYNNDIEYDFSVNINPLGMPGNVRDALIKSIDKVCNYPDDNMDVLRSKIGAYFSVNKECVLCANGASQIINAICYLKKINNALLIAPGFSGYIRSLEAVHAHIDYVMLKEKDGFSVKGVINKILYMIIEKKPQIVFVTNPSNPVGRITLSENILLIAKACKDVGALLVVDECFIELTEKVNMSCAEYISDYPNMIILRAFTKSFAIPGIRLGYMICSDVSLVNNIKQTMCEWSVSVPANEAGLAACECTDYLKEAVKLIKKQREYLSNSLKKLGLKVYGSDANYLLFSTIGTAYEGIDIYDEMLKQRVLIRDCSDYIGLGKGYYRVAVKKREENDILIKCLTRCIKNLEVTK